MLSERSIAVGKSYKVVENENDAYFDMLPNHELSALYNLLNGNHKILDLGKTLDVGNNIGLS